MRRRLFLSVLACAVLAPAVGVWADLPPLIPREVLFGNPDKAGPQISPDGTRMAYLAPDEGVLNVWMRTIGQNDDKPITKDRKRGIRAYFWAPNNNHILYIQDKDGDENWHVYAVDLKTMDINDLTPMPKIQARITAVEQTHPDEILVGINDRDPRLHDVYRINITTGDKKLEAKNDEGFVGYLADHDLKIRAALKSDMKGGFELAYRDDPASAWRTITTWGVEDSLTSKPIAFTPDGNGLYVLNSAGTNTTQLRRLDLGDGSEKVMAQDNTYDVGGVMIHPINHNVQAVAFNRDRLDWQVIDTSIEGDINAIKKICDGDFGIINRDNADKTWLVAYNIDNGPVRYYAYDRQTRKGEFLFTNRKDLEKVTLAEMKPIEFKAGDGLTVHGYLTTPPGIEAKNLPTVVFVHGGPWYRDSWGLDPEVQWLANRGYAVLQINFRGSTGYGKEFLNAANREWGGKMHQDLVDGVKWGIKKGIVNPDKVAIMGASYGGYATLVGMTTTPDLFCCGVDMVGPSNLITFMNTIPPYWKTWESVWWTRVGHPEKDAEFLKSRSPLFKIDQITKPLLIGQGANDPRIKVDESRQMVDAIKTAGKTVEYVEYPDEGHGFARPENRLDFFAKAEKFLATHVGGRYEQ
ncbi:MAG TPA: S9 family peptidase [Phycisphaerae bacterium]|nr:S9 family peptidase [Phycisphaerae bacterium]